MPVYYRKRISNGKGFRLNLHGSKKGLGASYSLHTKKKKGEAAITFNSKRGWTASIHGSGLRWQSSQKGKGVTGKTREQISRDAASKKWNREREVEERKRTREYARREKERNKEEARLERELAAQHRRMQKVRQAKEKANEKRHKAIDNHTSKIADRAKKRFLKIQTEFEKFDEQIYPKIDQHEINIDNYDGSEEQLIKLFSENFEIQSKYENEGQEILNYQMTMTETVVLDNQDAVATRLKRDFGVIWSSLSKGILDLQVNEDSVDRMRDNTEILDSLCDRLVSYYLDYILNEYLSYCFSKKELSDTVLKELNNICAIDFNDSKIFVNC